MPVQILILNDCKYSVDGINTITHKENDVVDADDKILSLLSEDDYQITLDEDDEDDFDFDLTDIPSE